jgi:Icc protein
MLIAQITDLHIRTDAQGRVNAARLEQVLEHLAEAGPALIVATGDLADHGDVDSYRRLKALLAAAPAPVHLLPGNHDCRDALLSVFPETPVVEGRINAVVEVGGRRIILLDTLLEGRHGGHFSDAQGDWLAARLAEAPDTPALIAMHHPPVPSGIEWMDIQSPQGWADALARAVEGHGQIVGYISGHIHRPAVTQFMGRPLVIGSSCAPQLVLDLLPLEQSRADGRPMIVAEPPAYTLHDWTGRGLVSHFATATRPPVLARHVGEKEDLPAPMEWRMQEGERQDG